MPRPFFLLLLCLSSAYGVVFTRCCNLPTWGGQHRHLHSVLGIVAYFSVNYKFFDRRCGGKGDKERQNGRHASYQGFGFVRNVIRKSEVQQQLS